MSSSIQVEIRKKSYKTAARVSVFLFLIISVVLLSNEVRQQHRNIKQKIEIDSQFITNAIKIGDIFFVTKYLSAFVDSGIVEVCGVKEYGGQQWISVAPNKRPEKKILSSGMSIGLFSSLLVGEHQLTGSQSEIWSFLYAYRINHIFIVYAAVVAIIFSVLIFAFLNRVLQETANFFTEPVSNISKDLDSQRSNTNRSFSASHYSNGKRFKETDRFVEELESLLEAISLQNEKIKRAEVFEALSRLGRQVNHDIQSPLGALRVAVEQLDKNKESAVGLIKKSVERIENIVADLKIESASAEALQTNMVSTDLNEFVEQIISEKDVEYNSTVEFEFRPDSQPIVFPIDRGRLSRALSNVINNGVEAVQGQPAKIEVLIEKEGEGVHILLSDNGPGVPEHLHSKIFEYGFSQGKAGGTGTGLSQARETCRLHNGNLTIRRCPDTGKNQMVFELYKSRK